MLGPPSSGRGRRARLDQLVDQSGDERARSVRMNKTGSWSRQMGMEIATDGPELGRRW